MGSCWCLHSGRLAEGERYPALRMAHRQSFERMPPEAQSWGDNIGDAERKHRLGGS